MKIAFIGTRGVPANYGGYETCVEELGSRLVKMGHQVTIYCRKSRYPQKIVTYLGIRLVYLPNLRVKYLDTLSHTFLSVLHALRQQYDVLMVFNAANSFTLIPARFMGNKIAINTDGLEWKRGKWGRLGKAYFRAAAWFSTKIADRIVTDSPSMKSYYRDQYGIDSALIAYGAYPHEAKNPELLASLGLRPGEYFLQITRFEPENNPLLTVQAFNRLKTDKKLVLVGGVHYESDYSKRLKATANDHVCFPGFIYDKDLLRELWCNCYAYIHGNEAGGTNPALLQAMGSGCFIIAIDVSFNNETLADCGVFFNKSYEDLMKKMGWALDHSVELDEYKRKAKERIQLFYTWDLVADQYEKMFLELVSET